MGDFVFIQRCSFGVCIVRRLYLVLFLVELLPFYIGYVLCADIVYSSNCRFTWQWWKYIDVRWRGFQQRRSYISSFNVVRFCLVSVFVFGFRVVRRFTTCFSLLYGYVNFPFNAVHRAGGLLNMQLWAVSIAPSYAVEHVNEYTWYGRRLVCSGGSFVPGCNCQCDRRPKSEVASFTPRYNPARDILQPSSWGVFTSPSCVRRVTPHSLGHWNPDYLCPLPSFEIKHEECGTAENEHNFWGWPTNPATTSRLLALAAETSRVLAPDVGMLTCMWWLLASPTQSIHTISQSPIQTLLILSTNKPWFIRCCVCGGIYVMSNFQKCAQQSDTCCGESMQHALFRADSFCYNTRGVTQNKRILKCPALLLYVFLHV